MPEEVEEKLYGGKGLVWVGVAFVGSVVFVFVGDPSLRPIFGVFALGNLFALIDGIRWRTSQRRGRGG